MMSPLQNLSLPGIRAGHFFVCLWSTVRVTTCIQASLMEGKIRLIAAT
jgi:hypothetical protein